MIYHVNEVYSSTDLEVYHYFTALGPVGTTLPFPPNLKYLNDSSILSSVTIGWLD